METVQYTNSLSMGEWFFSYILALVPIVGIIMLFVWAFGSETQPNRRNWAKAMLIFYSIIFVLAIIVIILIGAAFGALIMGILGMADSQNGF